MNRQQVTLTKQQTTQLGVLYKSIMKHTLMSSLRLQVFRCLGFNYWL
jgi:hypothetical protein